MGTLGSRQAGENEKHGALYGVYGLNFEPVAKGSLPGGHACPKKIQPHQSLTPQLRGIMTEFLLDFRSFRAFNPRTSRKDVLFDQPPGP
jgi:hypothetical protein